MSTQNNLIKDSSVSIQDLYPKGTSGQVLQMSGSQVVWGAGGGGSSITIKDEGVTLTTAVNSIDFVGAGVTATAIGNDVTVTIPGGGGGSPGGTSGQVQYNNAGSFGGFTVGGDATLNTSTGTLTIANNVVSNAKLATIATASFKGRTTAGTGNVEDLTATQATALLNALVGDSGAGGTKGLAPAPAAGDAAAGKFLKADGTWSVPSGGGGGTPGGSSGQLQYNNAGAFGGTAAGSYATSGSLFTLTAQAATDKPLIIKAAASQTANLQEWQNSSGTIGSFINSSMEYGNDGGATRVLKLGVGAGTSGTLKSDCVFIGPGAGTIALDHALTINITAVGSGAYGKAGNSGIDQDLTAVGYRACYSANGNSDQSTGIGSQALFTANATGNTAVGYQAGFSISTGANNTFLGWGSNGSALLNGQIAIGSGATTTAANQLVIGSSTASTTDVYIGNGVTNASPAAFAFQPTGGSGTNIAGSNITIAGGKATGNAVGGSILFKTSDAGSTGTTLQSLTTKWTINAAGHLIGSSIAGSTTEHSIWSDSTQKAFQVYVDGIEQTLQGCIFTQTSDQTIANTTTETTLIGSGVGTVTLPANFWVAGKTVRIKAYGKYSTDPMLSGNETVKVKIGSTTISTNSGISFGLMETDSYWEAEVIITCRTTGVSGTVYSQGLFSYQVTGSTRLTSDPLKNSATDTIDTTASAALNLTFQWPTADAGDTITTTNLTVEVLN